MRRKAPDTQFYAELHELNRQFLELITHPAAHQHPALLQDLPGGVTASVAALSGEARTFLAGMPGLLAEFAWVSAPSAVADIEGVPLDPEWRTAAQVFVAGLMTYLWQLARRDSLASALCLGLSAGRRQVIAAMSFTEIQHNTPVAIQALRLRHGSHPRLWPELVRAARHLNPELRDRCRADIISLGLTQGRRDSDGWRLDREPCTMRRDVRAVTEKPGQDVSQRHTGVAGDRP